MKNLKQIYIYDLYIRNQELFHRWLFVKKTKILSSGWTWLVGGITAVVLAMSVMITFLDSREVSTYRYESIESDIKIYKETVPEYGPRVKEYMADGKIVDWEDTKLRKLIIAYYTEKERLELIEAKRKLTEKIQ